jgi:hypothetical protein
MTTEYTTVDRIIAKIDNDFNPNNSDWIPRVGAWIHDALMQLDCVPTEKVKKKLTVKDKIARTDCLLPNAIKVYDSNGCPVKELDNEQDCSCESTHSSKGEIPITPETITREGFDVKETVESVAFTENVPIPYPPRYNVVDFKRQNPCKRGFVRIDAKTLELNFDDEFVIVEYSAPKQVKCQFYNCVCPVIPNDGKLIEAITYYCMYKMLTRGYVHPVMNLAASQYGTNPYYIWMQTKEEAKRSVINDGTDQILDDLWRSAFYIGTFNPRGKS